MTMLSVLISFGSLFLVVHPFLLSNDDEPQRCYELELENCFREAFLSAIHPPIFHKRDVPVVNQNETTIAPDGKPMDKKKRVRQIQICHDVRKFSSCFIRPGCSDQQAANIASVQYHMVFGKKLPMHVFLAYRGYGRELCDQQCYGNNLSKCKNKMSQDEQQEEQGYILEISTVIGHISPERDVTVACSRFNKLLINLLRLRKAHCGEMARCTCTESNVQEGVNGCNSGCERLLLLDLDQMAINSQNRPFSFSICNLPFFLLSFLCIVIF